MAVTSLGSFVRLVLINVIVAFSAFSLSAAPGPAETVSSDLPGQQIFTKSQQADSLHLTKQKVRDWIETRIEVAEIQKQMKANASDFDNVVQVFYSRRESLLDSKGWSVKEFDHAKERIHAAISAMDLEDDLNESRADHEEEVADIKANEYFSEKQKEEIIKGLQSIREQQRELYIEPTKPDWPAVQPYRIQFQQMSSWIAGNSPNPPLLE